MIEERPPLTVKETATALGLSVACIRSWVASHRISYLKLGRAIRIPASEIERIYEESRIPARDVRSENRL
jgi:excisionase family DNA binding protein